MGTYWSFSAVLLQTQTCIACSLSFTHHSTAINTTRINVHSVWHPSWKGSPVSVALEEASACDHSWRTWDQQQTPRTQSSGEAPICKHDHLILLAVISFKSPWVQLNRLRSGNGRFAASLKRWGISDSDMCPFGNIQTRCMRMSSTDVWQDLRAHSQRQTTRPVLHGYLYPTNCQFWLL
mgnify:CR=1 FL=1